jgi:bifunctional non-homologous end joining protein LigD
MLATLADTLPTGDGWAYEMKWDGVRALAIIERGQLKLLSRNGNDVTVAYPEVGAIVEALGGRDAMLDGEIVAADDTGRASFERLQARMHLRDRAAIAQIAREVPVAFMIFDIVWLDGRLLTGEPYTERRSILAELALAGPAWQTPSAGDDGDHAFEISKQLGFEGVVAKRLDSRYDAGRRSQAWRKVKHQLQQEFVVAGWVEGQGGRDGKIGALLIGYYDTEPQLRYAGKVGTGFSEAELDRLARALAPLRTATNPFVDKGIPRDAHFVEPTLVAQVRFTEWTTSGRIRHPAYLGLRDDKVASDVVRE